MKILFQGDSVTDGDRDRCNPQDLGNSYPRYASAMMQDAFPETEFEFLNLGINGTRSGQLLERVQSDIVAIQPDFLSILIGINDVWHRRPGVHIPEGIQTTDAEFESNLRALLQTAREKTNAKILLMTPFLLDAPDKEEMREEVNRVISIVKRLGNEFADAVLPLDELFSEALKTQPEEHFYSGDGVHPNAEGACFIGEHYLAAISPFLEAHDGDGENH